MKDEMEWHSGPPPHVGWWNASAVRDPDCWRWWDGTRWSKAVLNTRSSKTAAERAVERSFFKKSAIEWRHYYPDGARVPRINPEAA